MAGKDTDPVVQDAQHQADARLAAIEAQADAARELAELADQPMAPLNRPTEDVLGRKLPADPDEARIQQRAAHAERDMRVAVDTARVQRGLDPKYADK